MKEKYLFIIVLCIIAFFATAIYSGGNGSEIFCDIDTTNTHSNAEEAYSTHITSLLTKELQHINDVKISEIKLEMVNNNIQSITVYFTCANTLDPEIEKQIKTYLSGATNLAENNITIIYN